MMQLETLKTTEPSLLVRAIFVANVWPTAWLPRSSRAGHSPGSGTGISAEAGNETSMKQIMEARLLRAKCVRDEVRLLASDASHEVQRGHRRQHDESVSCCSRQVHV